MDTNLIIKKIFTDYELLYDDGNIFSFIVPAHLPLDMQGWGNGYVGIRSIGHPWYNKKYEDVPAEVHGGLTFGEMVSDVQIFGFDTAHYQDNISTWPKYKLMQAVSGLVKQVRHTTIKEIKKDNVFNGERL